MTQRAHPFAGKTIEFSVDNGVVFRSTYGPNGDTATDEATACPNLGATAAVDISSLDIAAHLSRFSCSGAA